MFNSHYGMIFCKQKSLKTESKCKDVAIRKSNADMAVFAAVKRETKILLDRDKMSRQVMKRNTSLSVSKKI